MYPASFDYSSPSTIEEALQLLAEHGDGARVLAGGHSLIPLMKLRFAQPAHVVDLRRIRALTGIRRDASSLVIGAMTTHAAVAASAEVRDAAPILAEAAMQIGDPQVRNRGTIGGSLAHADPAADLPAVMLAIDARIVVAGATGRRTVAAGEFFVDLFATALAPGELIVEVRVPTPATRAGGAYVKQSHPASRYAIVGVAATLAFERMSDRVRQARVALTGVANTAVRAMAAEEMIVGHAADGALFAAAADRVAADVDPRSDLQGDAEYKRQLTRVSVERALRAAAEHAR